MIRGTTPTHIFQLPMDTGDLKQIRITYSQLGRVLLRSGSRNADIFLLLCPNGGYRSGCHHFYIRSDKYDF